MINYQAFPKPIKVVKVLKRLSPIGKRTKKRLVENGSETDLHNTVWDTEPHICEVCLQYIQERSPVCFAHRLSKGMYPEYRYLTKNIWLVCSIDCHHKFDTLYQWRSDFQINHRNYLMDLFDKQIADSKINPLNLLRADDFYVDEVM